MWITSKIMSKKVAQQFLVKLIRRNDQRKNPRENYLLQQRKIGEGRGD
jgi:hypothetical protein